MSKLNTHFFRTLIAVSLMAISAGNCNAYEYTKPLDENGWTQLTPHPDATVYYVSNEGSDSNDGLSPETSFASLIKANSVMNDGDWALFRRGDTFNGTIQAGTSWPNGISEEYMTVFGAYGDESLPRPIFTDQFFNATGGASGRNTVEHIAFLSLHIWMTSRDADHPDYVGDENVFSAGGLGFFILRPGEDILFEDVMVETTRMGMAIQAEEEGIFGCVIRRCTVVDNYNRDRGQGLFIDNVHGLLIEECVWDHNGFSPFNHPNSLPSPFNHNLYIQYTNSDVEVLGNLIARGSSNGLQLRCGGRSERNVFVHNAIQGFTATDNIQDPVTDVATMNDNVAINAAMWEVCSDGICGTRGWGLELILNPNNPIIPETFEIQRNIVANAPSAPGDYALVYPSIADARDNIIYNVGNAPDTPGTFPDPDRTSATYNASLGGEASMEAYLSAARLNRKGNWDPAYAPSGLWNYIREGFGITSGGGVLGVELNRDTLSLNVGMSTKLVASISPFSATNKNVTWNSDNTEVATVDQSGLVTAVSKGTAHITVTTEDGGFTSTALVVVMDAVPFTTLPVTLDAIADDAYSAELGAIDKVTEGSTPDSPADLFGTWQATYSDENLYLLIDITDDIYVTSEDEPYLNDCVEVYLDGDNSKGSGSDGDNDIKVALYPQADGSLVISNEVWPPNPDFGFDRLEGAMRLKEDGDGNYSGYVIELSIPLDSVDMVPEESFAFGIDFQLSDNDIGSGDRDSVTTLSGDVPINRPDLYTTAVLGPRDSNPRVPYRVGPIMVDGHVDSGYSNVLGDVSNLTEGDPVSSPADVSGAWIAAYDLDYLYILVDVVDDVLVLSESDAWLNDSVELFLDGDNSKSGSSDGVNDYKFAAYPQSDGTLVLSTDVWPPNPDRDYSLVQAAHQIVENSANYGGYMVEFKLPLVLLGMSPQEGWEFGIDIQINDNDTGGDRDHTLTLSGSIPNNRPDLYSTARLGSPQEPVRFPQIIGAYPTGESGKYTSPWFGNFEEIAGAERWLLHDGMGWIYDNLTESDENLILYSLSTDAWIYSAKSLFPYFYIFGSGWGYYYHVVDGVSYYYDYPSGNWYAISL